jgi:uncharacterized protein YtpQ (UPF0354 family)
MDARKLKEQVEERLKTRSWNHVWNQEKDRFELRIAGQDKPFEISIPHLFNRLQESGSSADEIIADVLGQIEIVVESVKKRKELRLAGNEHKIYPVMRSASFPTETNGKQLICDDHTAESRIYYALDLGQSYTLLDEWQLKEADWSHQELKERALFNVRRLDNEAKKDSVADNDYYFFSAPDGYAASRILNQALLQEYAGRAKGQLCAAIPHQDVLILADIRNPNGYDILGQMCFQFFANGQMPITALPFEYRNGMLEPIFILARRRPQQKQ